MPKMGTIELQSIVKQQIRAAEADKDTPAKRGRLLDRYLREPYGDEMVDRSSVISADVMDTLEWIKPELMDIFLASGRPAEFLPVGPEDEDAADQETDVVNHIFMEKNAGFQILYEWFTDGLLQKNGYVKSYWDPSEEVSHEQYESIGPDELAQIMAGLNNKGDVEVAERIEDDEGNITGVKLKITDRQGWLCIDTVPVEEVLVVTRHNSINLDDASFVAHKRKVTTSELVAMGYDREQVEGLSETDDLEFTDERWKRHDTRRSAQFESYQEAGESMKEVLVYECYIMVDYDDDGIAERRKIVVGGTVQEILRKDGEPENEEVDSQPFSALAPIILPHRHVGISVAETVDDLQRIQTVLLRQLLDNVYLNNNATTEIPEEAIGDNTIDDFLNPRPGRAIRTAKPGMMREITPPTMAPEILAVIEHVETKRESRSGVSRLSQGLNPDVMNQAAERTVDRVMTAAMKKVELIARVYAETGVKHLFMRIHKLLSQHARRPLAIKLHNKWEEIDPRQWKHRTDMTVKVGLGTGNRDRMLVHLNNILERQVQAMAQPQMGLVTPENIHHTLEEMVQNAGFRNPEQFFTDPKENPATGQQQPNEQAQAAQALAQIEMTKVQQRAQEAQGKQQLEMVKLQMEDDRERDKMELQAITEMAKIGKDLNIADIRAITERDRNRTQQVNGGIQ